MTNCRFNVEQIRF